MTRTPDTGIRNPELYPPELRGHLRWINKKRGLAKIVKNSYTNDQLFARSFSFRAQGNFADLAELLEQLKEHLNDKERMILEERLLTDEPMTLQNIADKFDISRERVRQIEVNLLAKMKKYLESEMPDIVDFFDGEKIIVNASD